MYASLKEYIDRLDREGELVRVTAPVDPVLEMAEIADRMAKSPAGGKALLFERTGTEFPVLMNLFGSDRRMAMALGVERLGDIAASIGELLREATAPKGTLGEKLGALPLLGRASRWFPKRVRGRGACQQVVWRDAEADLGRLPVLHCWPCDGGRFVTLPMVHTVDPDTGVPNVGMYRMQVFDAHTTGMHWHMHKTGARHYEAYRRAGRRMPVSVCLGGDPVYTYAATAPLPDGIDEYLLAGFLRRRPVRMVRCLTNELWVPDDCDFVIEGYVDPAEEKVIEGPFGDHTGFYSLEDRYPLFHVTAITHRRDAVWPATVVGIPPQEDLYIAKATETIFLAPMRMAVQPDLTDLYMPAAGVAHNIALAGFAPRYPGHVRQAVSALWGAGQMTFNKYLLLVPAGADPRDPHVVAGLWRGADLNRALVRGEGVLDVLDHAAAVTGYGGKLAVDLTDCRPDAPLCPVPERIEAAGGIAAWSVDWLAEWGVVVVFAEPDAAVDAAEFLTWNGLHPKALVLFDSAASGLSGEELLWLATGNTDAGRDVTLRDGVLIADARTKLAGLRSGYPTRFPNVVVSDDATIRKVDARWNEYGLGDPIPSPSLRYRRLVRSDRAEV